jgi:hypothetical protein
VPLHPSTCKVLEDYIARRQRHWAGRPVSSYLFVSSWGNRLDSAQIVRCQLSCPVGDNYLGRLVVVTFFVGFLLLGWV